MNNEILKNTIDKISNISGIQDFIIEKDYHLTCLLERITSKIPNIIIKGDTSLSKCFHVINRFSEDIDLNVLIDGTKVTESTRRSISKAIIDSIDELSYILTNKEDIKCRMDYNKYVIDYTPLYDILGLRQYIIIETVFSIKAYPSIIKPITTLVEENIGEVDFSNDLYLPKFNIHTQTMDRTFIDKLFAICDYYIDKRLISHSRHLYDIHRIYPFIKFNTDFYKLLVKVKELRKHNPYCYSVQSNQNLTELLGEIIDTKCYQSDYDNITRKLLYDETKYDDTIQTLYIIIDKLKSNL